MRILSSQSWRLAYTALVLATTPGLASAQSGGPATAPRAAALYTDEQAERGNQVFGYRCIACHQRTDYANPDFRLKWNGQTAFALFERIRSSMPDSDPGSYGINEYQEVVAYILKLNGLPAGSAPFAGDSVAKATVLDFPPSKPAQSHSREVAHALRPSLRHDRPAARAALPECCSRVSAAHRGDPARH